VQSA
jgi:secreted Zn-dependent insulinase-like peptidase